MEILIGLVILLSIIGAAVFYLDVGVTKILIQFFKDLAFELHHKYYTYKKDTHIRDKEAAIQRGKNLRKHTVKKVMEGRKQTMKSQSDILAQIRARRDGTWQFEDESVTDVGELLSSPKVKKQLRDVDRFFKGEVLRALQYGKEPPLLVGRGKYNLETLKQDWNNEWQSIADDLDIHLWGKPKSVVGSPGLSAAEYHRTGSNPTAFFAKPSPPPNPPSPGSSVDRLYTKLKRENEELKLQLEETKRQEILKRKNAADQLATGNTVSVVQSQEIDLKFDAGREIFAQLSQNENEFFIDKKGFWKQRTGSSGPK